MNAVRGKVRGGRIETEAELPELVVLTASIEEPFDLDDTQLGELECVAAADVGDVETSEVVVGRLLRGARHRRDSDRGDSLSFP